MWCDWWRQRRARTHHNNQCVYGKTWINNEKYHNISINIICVTFSKSTTWALLLVFRHRAFRTSKTAIRWAFVASSIWAKTMQCACSPKKKHPMSIMWSSSDTYSAQLYLRRHRRPSSFLSTKQQKFLCFCTFASLTKISKMQTTTFHRLQRVHILRTLEKRMHDRFNEKWRKKTVNNRLIDATSV